MAKVRTFTPPQQCVATTLDLVGKWFTWKIPANQEVCLGKQEHEQSNSYDTRVDVDAEGKERGRKH